jgi:hypothetical protein
MTRKGEAASSIWPRLSLLGILLIAFALRTYRLDYQEISGDEAFGYFFSLQSPPDIVRATLALGEPHPIASYYVQKGWIAAAGDSEYALRYTSVWWSVVAVALLYVLARRLGLGVSVSLLSSALLAINPYLIWHSQNARMYSMSLALTLASTWLAVEAILRRRWTFWVAYVAASWLCLQTHYYAVFVILAQNALVIGWTLVGRRAPRRLAPWFVSQLVLGLLILPWLLLARDTLTGYGGNGDSPALGSMLARSFSVFAVGETLPGLQRTLSGYLAGVLAVVAVARLTLSGPRGWRTAAAIVIYLAIPLLGIWAGAQSRPIFDERYIVAAAPAFYLLASAAILGMGTAVPPSGSSGRGEAVVSRQALARRALKGVAAVTGIVLFVASLISLGNFYTGPAYSKTRGWRELASTLARLSGSLSSEQVRLIQNVPDPALWYYYRGPVAHLVLPPAAFDVAGADDEAAKLAASGVQRVILSKQQADRWDGSGIAQAALSKYYAPVAAVPVGPAVIHVYTRPPTPMSPASISFADGVTLAAAVPDSRQLIPGGLLAVHLQWGGRRDALSGNEKITLQVLDSQGALAAQTDQSFGASEIGAPATSYGILVPRELSPGTYRLVVAIYDPGRPDSPRWLTTTGADHVDLGELYVR